MPALAVDDRNLAHAVFDGVQGVFDFGNHAAGNAAVGNHPPDGGRIDGRDQLALGIHHPIHIGKQDQPSGGERRGDMAGHQVGVDIVGFPLGAGPHGGDDGNEAFFRKGVNDGRIDAGHLPHHARVDDLRRTARVALVDDVHLAGLDEAAVLAAEPDGLAALLIDLGHDALVDLAAQDHFDNIHGGAVGQAHAAHELGPDAHLVEHPVDLGAAAMHHHRVEADKFKQRDVAGEVGFELLVHHGMAAVLDHHGHPGKLADVRQRLDQNVGHRRIGGKGFR
ncbi:hypothetical protein DESC_70067 [Desulfosarcina cetonica]|nr:hypothetical protein DESC_70067 [Desulfosarcina cetonica]